MKFRAKLEDGSCIQHLTRVISTMAKLTKSCVMRLTSDKVYLIVQESATNGGVTVWCQFAQCQFFNQYNLSGVSEEDNEIFLELKPESLLQCLKSTQNASLVKLTLTKKQSACLTVNIQRPTLSANRQITHDLPVNVVARHLWHDFEEPEMPDYDVSLYMPSLKVVRNIVDRMKNLSTFLTISADRAGNMKLMIETQLTTITSHFDDLQTPNWNATDAGPGSQGAESAEVRIDIRKFAQFLTTQQVNPARVICNLVDNQVAHFFLLHEDVTLQYFIPSVAA